MNHSFFLRSVLVAAPLLSLGCSSSDEVGPPAEAGLDAPIPPVSPAKRKFVEGKQFATSPTNLVADPGFRFAGPAWTTPFDFTAEYENFEKLPEDVYVDVKVRVDSRSPAGFNAYVATLVPAGAPLPSSPPVFFWAPVPGGQGPFQAQVWVSKSDGAGKPLPESTDAWGITAAIATESAVQGKAFDFKVDPASTRAIGGRTWMALRAKITEPLPYGGFFVVHSETRGGNTEIAAPELLATPLAAAMPTMSMKSEAATHARALRESELKALQRFRTRPANRPTRRPGL